MARGHRGRRSRVRGSLDRGMSLLQWALPAFCRTGILRRCSSPRLGVWGARLTPHGGQGRHQVAFSDATKPAAGSLLDVSCVSKRAARPVLPSFEPGGNQMKNRGLLSALSVPAAILLAVGCATPPGESENANLRGNSVLTSNDVEQISQMIVTNCQLDQKNCRCISLGPQDAATWKNDCLAELARRCPPGSAPACDDNECTCAKGLVAATGTCSGQCGLFSAGRSCQCDSACSSFGDCCFDYRTMCVSCAGSCGTFDARRGCQCDSQCQSFGDCCPDRQEICGGPRLCSCDANCRFTESCCDTCP
jgi:hypothetical protein